jgi:hypothetical protein
MTIGTLIPKSLFVGFLDRSHFLSLSFIVAEQFIVVFCPVIAKILSFVSIILNGPESSQDKDDMLEREISEDKAVRGPVVHGSYSRFLDDKKPSLASKSDVQKLKSIGYEKYRFVSKEFIARFTDPEGLTKPQMDSQKNRPKPESVEEVDIEQSIEESEAEVDRAQTRSKRRKERKTRKSRKRGP